MKLAFTVASMILLLLLIVPAVHCIWVQDSKWNERTVNAADVCFEKDIEFPARPDATGNQQQLPSLSIFNREATVLLTNVLRARLLDEVRGNKAVVEALQRIYSRDIVLSESMLEESVSNLGDLVNIRRAVHKLVAGEPIKVVVLGGSVSFGHGPRHVKNMFVNQFFEWINETFPHPEHQLINAAIPAVTSVFISPCVLDLVPKDTDLVLIEFTFNDSERGVNGLEAPTMRGLERMLRKLMRMPSQPGIIYLHYWAGRRMQHNYAAYTVEDAVNTILKFYGLTGFSMRDAVHQIHVRDELTIASMFQPEWDGDSVHPSCVGSRFFADVVIGHFQDMAAAEVMGRHEMTAGMEIRQARLHHNRESVELLGLPLQANNWGNLSERCILEPEELRGLVTPGQGFAWVDEGKENTHKWGFVGNTPGASLQLNVPMHDLVTVDNQVTIGLGFLVSYQHMGQALIECVAGCLCKAREYSFLHPYGISISSWRVMDVALPPGSTSCSLQVTIIDRTYSQPPENKVKLTSVMISAEKGFIMPWLFCDECLQ